MECKKTKDGRDFMGKSVTVSETGKPCLDWATQTLFIDGNNYVKNGSESVRYCSQSCTNWEEIKSIYIYIYIYICTLLSSIYSLNPMEKI
jgi:hypothetical protein